MRDHEDGDHAGEGRRRDRDDLQRLALAGDRGHGVLR
jgi:hypothetical protein